MRKRHIYLILLTASSLFFFNFSAQAQIKGRPAPGYNPDTTYIFKSPRPLIEPAGKLDFNNVWGADLFITNAGFGFGVFYRRIFSKGFSAFVNLSFSGARNTDEIEYYNPDYGLWRVPGKVNRLYRFPLIFGLEKGVFQEALADNFRPFVSAGAGPALIMSTPYEREFFTAIGYADLYLRLASFIGAGAYYGDLGNTIAGVNIRYYFIPFGDEGLESVEGYPLKDFGGLFLTLTIGGMF